MHVKRITRTICNLVRQKDFKLIENFRILDKNQKGKINSIKFEYLLVEKLGVEMKEVKKLVQLLEEGKEDEINYMELVHWMKNLGDVDKFFENLV